MLIMPPCQQTYVGGVCVTSSGVLKICYML